MHKYKRCSFANLRTKCPPQDDVIPNDHKIHKAAIVRVEIFYTNETFFFFLRKYTNET